MEETNFSKPPVDKKKPRVYITLVLAADNARDKEVYLVPLIFSDVGVENTIKTVGGKDSVRLQLEKLGFVPGAAVTLVSEYAGNVIVRVNDARVAISKEMAAKIMV